ncbi:PIR protein [Plasmodium ovale]|uniref:PIR protein n=1 Tax=Plasmodium ovale TaxID=36330 RepID=A0A1C3KK68_PLAOA|nr:PIR protein [Plasmodium ovale]
MTEDINENDLPSVKFEKDIKDRMNYSALERYVKNHTEDDEIDNWIQSFQKKVEQYLTDSSKDSSFDHDKRCRHFNYLINRTISKITALSDNYGKTAYWSQKIKDWRDGYYRSNFNLKCNTLNKYNDNDYKILGTFCEDSAFINKKLTNIKNSVHCPKILSAMSTRKDKLRTVRDMDVRKKRYTKIDINCSTEFLDDIYTSFNCTPIVRSDPAPSVPISNDNQLDSKEHSEGLESKSPSPDGEFPVSGEEVLTVPEENGENNSIGLVSLPILGVLALSFFLYKHTPLKSKFHTYFRNKGDILLNQNYEETEQMLSNIPNLNDMDPENIQYNISYQAL